MRPSRCLGPDDPQVILRGAGKGLTLTAATDETAAARVSIESFMTKNDGLTVHGDGRCRRRVDGEVRRNKGGRRGRSAGDQRGKLSFSTFPTFHSTVQACHRETPKRLLTARNSCMTIIEPLGRLQFTPSCIENVYLPCLWSTPYYKYAHYTPGKVRFVTVPT